MSDLYRFGQFVLDPRKRTLSRAGAPVSLTPKAFDVLIFLAQNPHRLVTKEELLQAVWGNTYVEEGNLTQYISLLRKALEDNSEDNRLIVTIARKGYQFTGNVLVGEAADTSLEAAAQVPAIGNSETSTQLVLKPPTKETRARVPNQWRRAAIVASALILAVVGYSSWRHLRNAPRAERFMLAVLPFQNLTGDPTKEYLADGLTEETISHLGRLNPQQLGVIARTSVMGYKHKDERLDQIGHDLSVQYVLESSLRESKDHMRITAQLIQVKDQTHLWAQDYDYLAKDIFNVQDDVAKAVAREIELRLSPQKEAELARPHQVNSAAFDAYLQGSYFFEANTDKDTAMSAQYFERATQLDPSYALAWVGLSRVRNWQANTSVIPFEEGHRLAREAVERALVLDPNLAAAHAQMGRIKEQADFDWAGADASFQRAIALEPGNPESVRQAAGLATWLGRFDEAIQLHRRAIDMDPLNADSWEARAEDEIFMGKLDHAEADFKKALELNPGVVPAHMLLAQIYVLQKRPQDALAEIKLIQYEDLRGWLYAIAYHALGRDKESDDALDEFISKYHASGAYQIADVYAFRNQSDKAFEWLERAYAQRDSGLVVTKVDPLLKSLHGDPRFAAFLKKIHLPV
jgi:TolB-like protein/DNA-binding winged helix-turn-helix (wHTH) protein/thioredoxin-like negative regulator of GroEL